MFSSMPPPRDSAASAPPVVQLPATDAARELGGGDLRQVAAALACEPRAPLEHDAAVRWALLVGDLIRFARAFPAPRITWSRRRRIGEPVATALARRGDMGDDLRESLAAARAHVLGILARHCLVDACFAGWRGGATAATESDRLEAWLMLRFADAFLGDRLSWPGKGLWGERPLVDALVSDGVVSGEPSRAQLHAHVAAGHARFLAAVPFVDRLAGLDAARGDYPDMRHLPAPPITTSIPAPPSAATADPRRDGRKRRAVAPLLLALMLIAGLAVWQHVLWRSLVADLVSRLAGGGG